MAVNGGSSGFNADKFRKLVAMFDSNYIEEAVTAFRLAVAELKKEQGRFCDRLVDSDEARELAEIECAKVRDELTRVLDQCARREADVESAQDVIDRLHERIAAMERKAASRSRGDSAKTDSTDDCDNSPPPPFYPDDEESQDDDAPGNEPAYRLPGLPIRKTVYWLVLLCFVFLYACAVAGRGHMFTIEEWQAENLITGGALLFAMVITVYVMGWKCGFSQTRVGQWCIRHAGSGGDMVAGLFVVIFLGCLAYMYFLAAYEQIDEIGLSLFGIVGAVFAAFYLQHLLQTFGWAGVGIKALMWLDFYCIGFSLLFGDIPGWKDFRHHAAFTREHVMNALYFSIVWGLFCILDTPTHWAIRYKKVRQIVTLPALFFLSFGSVEIADYAIEGRKPQPSVIEHAQPSQEQPAPRKPKHPPLRIVPEQPLESETCPATQDTPGASSQTEPTQTRPDTPSENEPQQRADTTPLATFILTGFGRSHVGSRPIRPPAFRPPARVSRAPARRVWIVPRPMQPLTPQFVPVPPPPRRTAPAQTNGNGAEKDQTERKGTSSGEQIGQRILVGIALLVLWRMRQIAKEKREKKELIQMALNPTVQNIHGNAGIADARRARKQGWL